MDRTERFAVALKKLQEAVADLATQERLLQLQNEDLALAELDGDQIVFEDWCAAVKAVVAAGIEYAAAEAEVET